jgi:hypothetical protein
MMSGSMFAWLDHDDNARRRMLEVVELFREKGTLDELGIGSIRDTFADQLFPGTSTIQTRVRYFLFIPWIYQSMERARVPSDRADSEARQMQHRLVESLKRGETKGQRGIIGRQAGESLKRPPATIYWNGLGLWGIRLFNGSLSQYHGSLTSFYREQPTGALAESGELVERRKRNWQSGLPAPPSDFLEKAEFRLRREEAQFLADQIDHHCSDSLLTTCLHAPRTFIRKAQSCWELSDLPNLAPGLRESLEDSRRFAYLMEGAVLLYNLMLAEKQRELGMTPEFERVDRYKSELDRWSDEIVGIQDDLLEWNLDTFELELRLRNARIPHQALAFCRTWMAAAREQPRLVANDPLLRALIANRERQLKGGLARLYSVRALETWSGASGLGRLDYRWGIGKSVITDIFDGLSANPGSS